MPTPALTANSPANGAISWTAFSLAFGGKIRSIPAGNTTSRFTWWRWNNGQPTAISPTPAEVAAGYSRTTVTTQPMTAPAVDPTVLWHDPQRTNYFLNPGVRGSLTSWTLGSDATTPAPTLTHNATGGEAGDGSALLTKGGGYAFIRAATSPISVISNDKVTVTYRIKPSVTQVRLVFRVTGGTAYNTVMKTGLTVDTWQTVTHTFTLPNGSNSVYPDIGWEAADASSGATLELDWALWEKSDTAGPYFDGTTTGASWSGTANNSTSTYAVRYLTAPGRKMLHVKIGGGGWYESSVWTSRGWTYETVSGSGTTIEQARQYDLLVLDAGYGALGTTEKNLAAAAWAEGISVVTTGNDTNSMPGLFTGVASRPAGEKTSAYNITPIGTHPVAQGWTSMVDTDNNFTLTGLHAEAVVIGEQLVGTSRLPIIVARDNATLNAKWVHIQNYAPTHVVGFLNSLSDHLKSGWKVVSANGARSAQGALETGTSIPTDLTSDDLLLFINRNGTPINIQNTNIVDGSIIVTESIVGDSVAANTITGTKLVAETLTAREISAGAITARQLSVSSIGADSILNGDLEDVDATTKIPAGWTAGYERTGTPTYGQNTSTPLSGTTSTTITVPANGVEGMASAGMPCVEAESLYFAVAFRASVVNAPITLRAYFGTTPDFTASQKIATTPVQPENVGVFDLNGTLIAKAANPAVGAGIAALLEGWGVPAANTTYVAIGHVKVPAGARYVRFMGATGLSTFGTSHTTTFDAFETRPVVRDTVIANGAITTRMMTAGTINGDRIQAGTLTADRIATSTLSSRTITLGSDGILAIASGGKILVGNTTTGWIADDTGFRLYQSGTLKVNLPTSGDPTFSGSLSAATGTFAGSLSAATGTFTGNLTGSNMTLSGVLTGGTIRTSGGWDRVELNGTNNRLEIHSQNQPYGVPFLRAYNVARVGSPGSIPIDYDSGMEMSAGGVVRVFNNEYNSGFGAQTAYTRRVALDADQTDVNGTLAAHYVTVSNGLNGTGGGFAWTRNTASMSWDQAAVRVVNNGGSLMAAFWRPDLLVAPTIHVHTDGAMHILGSNDGWNTFRAGAVEFGDMFSRTGYLQLGQSNATTISTPNNDRFVFGTGWSPSNANLRTLYAWAFYASSNGVTYGSSRQMKSNVRAFSKGAGRDMLRKINPVRFRYTANPQQEQVGFIAEDFEPFGLAKKVQVTDGYDLIDPKLADVESNRKPRMIETLGLDPMHVAGVLWQAVQELAAEVDALKAAPAR